MRIDDWVLVLAVPLLFSAVYIAIIYMVDGGFRVPPIKISIPTVKIKPLPAALLFCSILALGIFARTWEYGNLPPGLNQDEASSGVDAFSLYHFGMDRNGDTFPVQFVSWGSGQNTLYAYLMIPFIAAGGLTPITVRLPMLVTGILTLPLVFYTGRQIAGDVFGLLAMFFIAISPWHIILSRWGLESNILPFFFLAGFACFLKSQSNNRWFIPGCFLFGLSLYAYAPAYVVVPLFVGCASAILYLSKRVSRGRLVAGISILLLVGAPVGLYVLVNSLKLDTMHLGMITIPRLPSKPHYEAVGAVFQLRFFQSLAHNFWILLKVLWSQTDRLFWNSFGSYGYFYRYTFPLAIAGGVGLLLAQAKSEHRPEKMLLLAWLGACIPIGLLEEININRINIIFIPLILCMAYPLTWLEGRLKPLRWLLVGALLVGFAVFTRDYHSEGYRQEAREIFYADLVNAIGSARQAGQGPICVIGKVNMPYIYAMFAEQTDPANYLDNIHYENVSAPFRFVQSFGRYAFGEENCAGDPETIYVLNGETPPSNGIQYQVEQFTHFQVYKP